MNKLIVISIIINALATVGIADRDPELQGVVMFIFGSFVALSVFGAVMISSGNRRTGAILAIIGCVAFVPIGLLGVYGAKKVLDEVKREEFANRPGSTTAYRGRH